MTTQQSRLEAEKERRAKLLRAMDAGGCSICQDDYEWATMSGEYADERVVYQGYETADERAAKDAVFENLGGCQ